MIYPSDTLDFVSTHFQSNGGLPVNQPGDDELIARLTQIEERLAALETRAAAPIAGHAPIADDEDTYWALRRLRELAPEAGAVLFTGTVEVSDGERYEWQQTLPVEGIVESDWTLGTPVLAALAHPARLQIVRAVMRGRRSAAELQTIDGIESTGQLYHHVRQLVAAGWLRTAARARYAVPPERVVPLLVVMACVQH
ncbi:winged helix-turn-helix domain-containing protein [Actinoplanes sp. NPDC051411]|uniref:ArsR/SmtB family transcription factor n=1 Tax=Actinoplanes sp. NPDC051411 TaxID=3155522 RepID=UPI00344A70BA